MKPTNEKVIEMKQAYEISVKEASHHTLPKGGLPPAEEDIAYLFLCDLIEKGFLSEEMGILLTEGSQFQP